MKLKTKNGNDNLQLPTKKVNFPRYFEIYRNFNLNSGVEGIKSEGLNFLCRDLTPSVIIFWGKIKKKEEDYLSPPSKKSVVFANFRNFKLNSGEEGIKPEG